MNIVSSNQPANGRDIVGRFRKASIVDACLVILISVTVLLGWQYNLEYLKRIVPTLVAMNPLTAVCFLLSAVVLLLLHGKRNHQVITTILALVVAFFGLSIVLRYTIHLPFWPDRWLYRSKLDIQGQKPNVMALNTAISFLLSGLSLLLISLKTKLKFRVEQYMTLAICFLAIFALLGYAYGDHTFLTAQAFIPMAVNTALGFLLLGAGILFVRSNEGLMLILSSEQGAGYLMRRLVLIIILLPAVLGWLKLLGQSAGLFNAEVGTALSVAFNISLGFILVWITGVALYKKEFEVARSKDEFLSLATHQLQTPSTGVKAALSLLNSGVVEKLTPKQEELVRDAQEGNEREIRIVNDLLNVARADSGRMILKKEPTDLSKLVKDILHEQQPTIKSRKQQLDVEAESVVMAIDPNRLRMAIENLVSNASKYTPDSGKIAVKVEKTDSGVVIQVIDGGVGIADSDISKVFVKFTRLDNPLSEKRGGTGLGLYLVKQIVELHGGEIKVNSKIGKGSQFTIELPLDHSKNS